MSANEFSPIRTSDLHRWHREWGMPISATDIDQLVEYSNDAGPVALIEYKQFGKGISWPQLNALSRLGTMARLPVFQVEWDTGRRFKITAQNADAVDHMRIRFGSIAFEMDELAFVQWQYSLRGLTAPQSLEAARRRTG